MLDAVTDHSSIPGNGQWLSVSAFAAFAGVGSRSARRILSNALDGKPWRGHALAVRQVPAPGGLAFEVRADSLPGHAAPALPAVASVAPAPPAIPAPPAPRSGETAKARYEAIAPALDCPPGSPEHARAVAAASKRAGATKRTIYRWIAAYEAQGFAGLGQLRRADRGRRKHAVTRAWDAAVPFDAAAKAAIGAKLDRYIRSRWADRSDHGRRMIAWDAAGYLAELTIAAGFDPGPRELADICRLNDCLVRRDWREYSDLSDYDHDRKRWEDRNRPRVQRSRDACRPMEVVFGDVHPMDVLLPRADGSTFTARLIAFEDYATARLFAWPVFLGKGEGVRQEHIAAAIVAMTQEPGWGLPQTLYIDNGGEYGCADLAADAMQLAWRIRALAGEPASSAPPVVRALPYNAAAKPIESAFARLERIASALPGYIGGNRMAKKTANVGREPVPYPHGEAAFLDDLRNALAVYEAKPQSGMLAGRSPRAVYEAAVADGWRPVGIELEAMLAAFARDDTRVVRQGAFTFNSRLYTAPEIQALPAGAALLLRVPIFSGTDAVAVMREDGELLCIARPKAGYHPLDTAGAREAGRTHAAAREAVKARRADIDAIDPRQVLARLASRAGPAAHPESEAVVRLDKAGKAIGRAMQQTPADRRAERDERDQVSSEQFIAAARRLIGKTGTDG